MSKLLLFLISSFLMVLACTEEVKEPVAVESNKEKPIIDVCNINTEYLYCNLVFEGKPDKKLLNKHIPILHPWLIDSIPVEVQKKINSKEYFLTVSTFISYSDLDKFTFNAYQDYANEIEKAIRLIVGSSNSYPIANVLFQFLPSKKNDSSYMQINIDCSESINTRRKHSSF